MPLPNLLTYGSIYSETPAGGSTVSANVTIDPSCMMLIILICRRNGDVVSNVKIGGQNMTYIAGYNTGSVRAAPVAYYFQNPPTGTQTFNFSVTATSGTYNVWQGQFNLTNILANSGVAASWTAENISPSASSPYPDTYFLAAGSSYYVLPSETTGATTLSTLTYHRVVYKTSSAPSTASFTFNQQIDGNGSGTVVVAITGIFGNQLRVLGYPGL